MNVAVESILQYVYHLLRVFLRFVKNYDYFQLRAIDLLHKAAFRRGLGNSLFIAKYQLGKISPETLQYYVKSNFLTGRSAVVGLGVDQDQLVEYAQGLALDSGEGKARTSEYKGGEIR